MTSMSIVVRNALSSSAPYDTFVFSESTEEQYLLALSTMRMVDDSGIMHSFEELLDEDGLNLADIDSMEDVEIE